MLPKKTQTIFSPWQVVGSEVLQAVEKWRKTVISIEAELPITGDEYVAILVAAINPPELPHIAAQSAKTTAFASEIQYCHIAKPELTKRLTALIKKIWNDQNSVAKATARILTERAWLVRPALKDGKHIPGRLRTDLQDTEIQDMLFKKGYHFKINAEADTVKKAVNELSNQAGVQG